MEISYEIIFNYVKSISYIFLIILIGYIVGRLTKLIIKILLSKFLGIDKWLEMKNIKIFDGKFSNVISNLVKDFMYLIFFSYALMYSDIEILIWIGKLALSIIMNLLVLIIILIIVHLFAKMFLEDFLSKITFFKEIEELKKPVYIIIYFVSIIIALDYLGLLSKALLYIFLISFSAIIIFISIVFGIAYGEKIKEKIKNNEKR
ncbi:MAG: hypothetical protein QW038_02170 [Nanopusillaceae archaeon]